VSSIQRELERKTRELSQVREEMQETEAALRVEREVYTKKLECVQAEQATKVLHTVAMQCNALPFIS
jgi:hypothetical protein